MSALAKAPPRRSVRTQTRAELDGLANVWWVERLVFIEHIDRLEKRNALLQQRLDEAQAALAKAMVTTMKASA